MIAPAKCIEIFNRLWAEGGVVVVAMSSEPGVVLPPHLKKNDPIVLHYPKNPVIAIDDLTVDETGIRATLSFNRSPYATFIPWEAVLVMQRPHDDPDGSELPSPTRHLKSVP